VSSSHPTGLHLADLGLGKVTGADAWLAGAVAVASAGIALAVPSAAPYRPVGVVALVLALAASLGLLWRQVAPLVAMAACGLVVVVNAAAGFPIGLANWPTWIALFTCFAVGGRRLRATSTVMALLGVAGYLAFDRGDVNADVLTGIAMSFLIATIAGDATRSRKAHATAAEARLVHASRQSALEAERLLLQERGRLARELHDALGHTVNVMVLQAGVGRRVFTDNPAYAREALVCIETVGRGALDELDRLLRVLQPDERPAKVEPFAPTISDLHELAERIRATGRQVDLRTDGVEVTANGARALYRIIQEALTNAVRHTSTGRIRVSVSRIGDEILLDVTNEGRNFAEPVPGRGLVNMRERARLEGGQFEAGPVADGFRVRTVLPLASAVSP
jgi:signal transduction histidine kinase